MRPFSALLGVLALCACAAWLAVAADTAKKKSEEKSSTKSEATKPVAAKPAANKPEVPRPVAAKPTPPPQPVAALTPKDTPVAQPAKQPPAAPAQPVPAPPKADNNVLNRSTVKLREPSLDEKPRITTPAEAPPKDVTTSNRATTRTMESKESGEFDKSGEEEDAKAASRASKSKGTATTSSDMAGWELYRYQERDYVSANSIHKFYRFNNLDVDGNNVWFRSPVLVMKATLGSQDLLINNIKFVLSDPVVELKGKPCFSRLDLCKLIDPVLRPSYIGSGSTFDTVILDPGHGGHDSGARGIYGYEKDFALKLAFALKAELERRGLKVVMTRRDDTFISLSGRVAYANKIPNSIYVSLHFNSGGSSATGIETFALTPQGASSVYGARSVDAYSFNGNQRDSENIALATAIHASVVHHFKFVDRGVKRARWYVLKGLERPGVLFEGGFVTNASDAKFIAADNFRSELAATLGQAILNYRRALQPR